MTNDRNIYKHSVHIVTVMEAALELIRNMQRRTETTALVLNDNPNIKMKKCEAGENFALTKKLLTNFL